MPLAVSEKILDRLIDFAINCVKYISSLPRTVTNQIYVQQLIRSSSSPAANFSEAMTSISKREWSQKIGICRKEAKESCTWLKLLSRVNSINRNRGEELIDEADQLVRILSSMSKTANNKSLRS